MLTFIVKETNHVLQNYIRTVNDTIQQNISLLHLLKVNQIYDKRNLKKACRF